MTRLSLSLKCSSRAWYRYPVRGSVWEIDGLIGRVAQASNSSSATNSGSPPIRGMVMAGLTVDGSLQVVGDPAGRDRFDVVGSLHRLRRRNAMRRAHRGSMIDRA